MKTKIKRLRRIRRHQRVRGFVSGTSNCPRLSVFRSNKHLWAQLIDDSIQKTIASAEDLDERKRGASRVAAAEKVGLTLSQKAVKLGIKKAVFDRGGYQYHGLVKAVAGGARKGGLKF